MPRDRQEAGACPKCGAGTVTCTYNLFQNAGERIDSWEHRCLSCNYRETKAWRTSDAAPADGDPTTCPYCGRKAPAGA
jgi:ssDNA-binding Zn-finger/Zn-ribbon topoisomerase 1